MGKESRNAHMGIRTTIVQSWPAGVGPLWIETCIGSVASAAERMGARHVRLGDELFDVLPDWAVEAGRDARLALTDYARLLWLRRLLGRAERLIWLDADVLIFDPDLFTMPTEDYAAARERWTWMEGEALVAEERVNNAAILFTCKNGLLHWYIAACERILREAPRPLNRTALGPQLLTALASHGQLPLIESVATVSPALMTDLLADDGLALADHRAHWGVRVGAAHLCRSLGGTPDAPHLIAEGVHAAVVDRLLRDGAALLNP